MRKRFPQVTKYYDILIHDTESRDTSALMSNASAPDSNCKLLLLHVVFLSRAVQEGKDIATDNVPDARIE